MNEFFGTVLQIIVPLFLLGVLIMVHELGHFGVAKYFKIKVLEFWIFMGPKLFSWKRKETEYSFRVIPIGGMVRMEGEETTSDDQGSFNNKHPAKRAAVIAAGPAMNILFALIVVIIIFAISGYNMNLVKFSGTDSPAYKAGIRDGDKLLSVNGIQVFDPAVDYGLFTYVKTTKPIDFVVQRNETAQPLQFAVTPNTRYLMGVTFSKDQPTIEVVDANMPAGKAGIKKGDLIKSLNGVEIKTIEQAQDIIAKNKGAEINVSLVRNGTDVNVKVAPVETPDMNLGIGLNSSSGNPIEVIGSSVNYCISVARSNFYTIGWLFSGKVSFTELSGPVGMVKTMGDVMTYSPSFWDNMRALLLTASFISLCLGVFNLLPFPALDGSKILILLFEIFTKKKLKPEREAMISLVGLAILLTFMVGVTVMDIMKFF